MARAFSTTKASASTLEYNNLFGPSNNRLGLSSPLKPKNKEKMAQPSGGAYIARSLILL